MRIDDGVLAVLSRAETDECSLMLTEQLDRKMYLQVNEVLEAAGGKWDRKAKAHLFDIPAADRIDQILISGEVEVPKDEFNFFESPANVVERLMELADVRPGMKVLEPSAGKGAIAHACVEAGAAVDCIDLMKANCEVLSGEFAHVLHMDFLDLKPTASYDRVVMNPPFAKQADIKHVQHALRFVKPGGLLVSVMSASVTFRDNNLTKGFRDLVAERFGTIEKLPEGSFKESGTMVNAVIVTIPAEIEVGEPVTQADKCPSLFSGSCH